MASLTDQLRQTFPGATLRETCESAVARYLPEVRTFPARVNLDWLCAQHGIEVRQVSVADFRGRIDRGRQWQATITLRMDENAGRRRFTLAHELGHWLLQEAVSSRRLTHYRGMSLATQEEAEEELLADAIAAEILMPLAAVRPMIDSMPPRKCFEHGPGRFGVTKAAFLRRYSEVSETRTLSATFIAARFDDPTSAAVVDDAWLASPGQPLRRVRDTTAPVSPVSFDTVQNSATGGMVLTVDGDVERWFGEAWFSVGRIPVLSFVGLSATSVSSGNS